MQHDLVIPHSLAFIVWQSVARVLRKITGYRYAERGSIRFSWAEISSSLGLSLSVIYWGRDRDFRHAWSLHAHLIWPNIFFALPFPPLARECEDPMGEYWGFSFQRGRHFFDSVHLNWGRRCKVVHFAWSWRHIDRLHQVWTPDGWRQYQFPWVNNEKSNPDGRQLWVYPYSYHLRNGDTQQRRATVHVERTEHRWRWFTWLPWPRLRFQSIHVEFDGEVGERTGSWKGGCIGCSYDMLPGETPRDTLWRMERERKFD